MSLSGMGGGVRSEEELLEYFLVAFLSVGGWSVDKVWALRRDLVRQGLADPQLLAALTTDEIFERLLRAGHKRGSYMTGLLAGRLHGAGEHIVGIGLSRVLAVLGIGTAEDLKALALPGVGPAVISTFLVLRGSG